MNDQARRVDATDAELYHRAMMNANRASAATVTIEPNDIGSIEVRVVCDAHGVIADRFAVMPTAFDSARRHVRTYHVNADSRVVVSGWERWR